MFCHLRPGSCSVAIIPSAIVGWSGEYKSASLQNAEKYRLRKFANMHAKFALDIFHFITVKRNNS